MVINIGICVGDWNSTARTRCNDLGVSHIRIDGGVQWHDIETSPGNYNFSAIDNIITQNIQDGRKVLWILCYNNPVYDAEMHNSYYGEGLITSNMRTAYKNYCVAAANHLAANNWLDDVTLELWNEPDISSTDNAGYWNNANGTERAENLRGSEYAATLNLAVPAIKAAQPNCKISAFSSNWPTGYTEFAHYSCPVITADTWSKIDTIGFHPYPQGDGFNDMPEDQTAGTIYEHFHNAKNKMIGHGMPESKKCWITEVGYNTVAGSKEVNQNDPNMLKGYLPRLVLNAILWGVQDFSAFTLTGADAFGIYDQGTQPARRNLFKNLCDAINGATYVNAPVNSGGNYVMKFTKGANTIYAFWTTGTSNPKTVDGHTFTLNNIPAYQSFTASAPDAPTGIEIEQVLSWQQSASATAYHIYNSTNNYATYTTVIDTEYSLIGFGHAGEEVTFRVYAYNANGESEDYAEITYTMGTLETPVVTYPVDYLDYNNLVCAYAFKKIKSTYTGSLVKVKQAVSGGAVWIGFDGVNIDKDTLETFANGESLNIDTLNDQSGHGRSCIQPTVSLRPLIAVNGVYNTDGMLFDGVDDLLPARNINGNHIAIAIRIKPTIVDSNARYCVQKDGTTNYAICPTTVGGNGKIKWTINPGTQSTVTSSNNISSNNSIVIIADYDGTTQRLRVNGVETTASVLGLMPATANKTSFGKTTYGSPFAGYIDFCVVQADAFITEEIAMLEDYLGA
jgi:hypothetical protein